MNYFEAIGDKVCGLMSGSIIVLVWYVLQEKALVRIKPALSLQLIPVGDLFHRVGVDILELPLYAVVFVHYVLN